MGFHDVAWAYSIDRPLAETAVLAALCHRTDDATHTTFVGQKTIADMIGSSPEKVLRALASLDRAGVISRQRRNDSHGYRTSDLITVNVGTYLTENQQGETPSRQNSYQEIRRDLPDESSAPTWQKVTAEGQPEDHSEKDQPDLSFDAFEDAWLSWPKKTEKKRSQLAFARAAKRRGADATAADVIRFGQAYSLTTERQYVPALNVWLDRERWTDDLPQAAAQPMTRMEKNLTFVAQLQAEEQAKKKRFVAGEYPDEEDGAARDGFEQALKGRLAQVAQTIVVAEVPTDAEWQAAIGAPPDPLGARSTWRTSRPSAARRRSTVRHEGSRVPYAARCAAGDPRAARPSILPRRRSGQGDAQERRHGADQRPDGRAGRVGRPPHVGRLHRRNHTSGPDHDWRRATHGRSGSRHPRMLTAGGTEGLRRASTPGGEVRRGVEHPCRGP